MRWPWTQKTLPPSFRTVVETWTIWAHHVIKDCLENGRPAHAPATAVAADLAWRALGAIDHSGFRELVEDHHDALPRMRHALVAIGAPHVLPLIDEALATNLSDQEARIALRRRYDALDPHPQTLAINFLLARTEPWFDAAVVTWMQDHKMPDLTRQGALENALLYGHLVLLRRAIAASADVNLRGFKGITLAARGRR